MRDGEEAGSASAPRLYSSKIVSNYMRLIRAKHPEARAEESG